MTALAGRVRVLYSIVVLAATSVTSVRAQAFGFRVRVFFSPSPRTSCHSDVGRWPYRAIWHWRERREERRPRLIPAPSALTHSFVSRNTVMPKGFTVESVHCDYSCLPACSLDNLNEVLRMICYGIFNSLPRCFRLFHVLAPVEEFPFFLLPNGAVRRSGTTLTCMASRNTEREMKASSFLHLTDDGKVTHRLRSPHIVQCRNPRVKAVT